jgi:hypothetical protein
MRRALTCAADTIFFGQSTTFWTVQAGLNIINRINLKAGFSGFYSASADTNIVGDKCACENGLYRQRNHQSKEILFR